MRFDVDYNLDICLKNEIIKIKECILGILKVTDIRELKELRHFLEDKIEELGIERDVDLKLYTKRRFLELSLSPSFEQAITKDLIDIRRW
ncbi:DNA polymerase beta [Clostridium sp.]|uniref:DNA polymerase beta n=1 Tax=Clostridium sp. TaxID=1506 RepID=UPI002903CD8A|nr:DNA polymerase beta [Clostridium sp.]MDU1310802.1 DNA polymerase beta [Clostridium sp.]